MPLDCISRNKRARNKNHKEIFTLDLLVQITVFFYLGFLSPTFTNHSTAGEGGGHFFHSSLPLPPASQTLRH